MASSGENGPKGYTRLDIKDKKLTEIRDDELINQEIKINEEVAIKWLKNGATPTDTVRNIFSKAGVMTKFANEKQGK